MRKLLSLLTVVTLTTPVPLNVIACGPSKTPAVPDETDYVTLAQTAKEKIQAEFAKLVNDGSNLRTVGNVTDGGEIMTYLKTIGQTADKAITQADSPKTVAGFLEVLKAQVLAISNNLVTNYPELKPLFNGINPNDILKINTNDLDKLLTNKQFTWQNNTFGLATFDAKQAPYSVTDWYYLTANLTLDFTCLDENAKVNTSTISQSYDMYFANDGSNLDKIVNVVTANIEAKLKVIKFVNIEYDKWDDNFLNQQNKVLADINQKLKLDTNLSSITNLSIETQNIADPDNNDYNCMKYNGNLEENKKSLTLINSDRFIKNSTDFNNAWNPVIAARENNFVSGLKTWKTKHNLTINNENNVFVFGDYTTTNWKISGLKIKTLSLPYYITSNTTTRASNTKESLAILEKLFVGPDALFQYQKNYSYGGYWNNNNFVVYFNPDTYDDFIKRNVTVQAVYDYVNKQTNDFGTKNKFIK